MNKNRYEIRIAFNPYYKNPYKIEFVDSVKTIKELDKLTKNLVDETVFYWEIYDHSKGFVTEFWENTNFNLQRYKESKLKN